MDRISSYQKTVPYWILIFNRLNKLLFGTFHIQIGKLYIKALTHQKDDYGSRQKKVNAGRLRNAHYW